MYIMKKTKQNETEKLACVYKKQRCQKVSQCVIIIMSIYYIHMFIQYVYLVGILVHISVEVFRPTSYEKGPEPTGWTCWPYSKGMMCGQAGFYIVTGQVAL